MDVHTKFKASKPHQDLDQFVVNLFIRRATQKRMGTLWLDTEQDAISISKAIEALPEILDALNTWKQSQDATVSDPNSLQAIYKQVNEKLEAAYNKAHNEG